MNFLLIATLLAVSGYVSADWKEYEDAVIMFDKLGLKYDEEYKTSRSLTKSSIPFPCQKMGPSSSVPTSVHKLRPADVKVVAALGDSLTAANGAKAATVIGLLTEYRGVSWSIGGDSDLSRVITLPNILKRYNPSLKGFSVGSGKFTTSGSKLNVAQPGHTSDKMLEQAVELVRRMKNDVSIKFEEDWKLVTFFIGGNDLCRYCQDKTRYEIEAYATNVKQALDYLHENLPRTLVNLVLTLNVAGVRDLSKRGFICKSLHNYLCECGISTQNAAELDRLVSGYQSYTKRLVESGRYDTTDDFTVVLQPFLEEMTPPRTSKNEPDYSYFAPDCFHFSQKGHETAAIELWSNMMEPVGQKATKWTAFTGTVKCPSEASPYIYTTKNS